MVDIGGSPLLGALRVSSTAALLPDDLPQVMEEARRHALAGLLYEFVTAGAERFPSDHVQALREDALAVSAASLRARLQLLQVLTWLERAGIVPIVLKGPALAARYWKHPAVRPCTDIDLFVPPSEFEIADGVLRSMGLSPMSSALEKAALRTHHHLVYRGATSVELHFRLNGGIGLGLSWELLEPKVRAGTFSGQPVRFLGTEGELIFLAVHAAGHLFERLSWLLDLKYFLQVEAVDWDVLVRTARHAGVGTSVWLALTLAREGLDARVPAAPLERLSPDFVLSRSLRALFPADSLVRHPLWNRRRQAPFVRMLLVGAHPRLARLLLEGGSRHLRRELGGRFPHWTPPHWRELL